MRKSIVLIITCICMIVSCKDSNKEETGTTFPGEFRFVWQDDTYDDGDEIGVYFTETKLFFWDYLGDEYDDEDDCYLLFEGATIIRYEGDSYTLNVIDFENGGTMEIVLEIEIVNGRLKVTDTDDEDIFHTKTDLTVSQLAPNCNDVEKLNSEMSAKPKNIFN